MLIHALQICTLGILLSSNVSQDLPIRDIDKVCSRLFNSDVLEFEQVEGQEWVCDENPFQYKVEISDKSEVQGYALIRKVFTCDPDACSKEEIANGGMLELTPFDDRREYFKYFAVFSPQNELLNLTVYEYQASYGHGVAKRIWLAQFIEKSNHPERNELAYGEDIDAISGATVSAQEMTNDINVILSCTAN